MRREGPEAQLVVWSVGTAARRAASHERAAELARSVDWERLAAMLAARRLLAQLGERLVQISDGRAPEHFRSEVERTITQTRRQGALLELVAERFMRALADAGIDSLVLKGAFLGEAVYGDLGRRPAGDVDLLVAPGHLAQAVEIARLCGYGAPPDHVGTDGLPLLHYAMSHESGKLPRLELHWRIHWYERTFACDMLTRARKESRWRLRAAPVDELTSLLLFYARDGFLDLRLATDLGAWWDRFGSSLEPGALAAILKSYPELDNALTAAVTVAERVVGLPSASLMGARRQRVRPRLAARLANPGGRGDQAQLNADVGLVDWLLAPRGGHWDFARRQLFPPREVLDQRSCMREERRVSPIGHGVRVLGRFGLSIARLAPRSFG
jgi:Uncharacterised nucleotidyltransferase